MSNNTFTINFKSKDQARIFREPLARIGFATGVGIVLRISKKVIKVNAVSDTNNILAQIEINTSKVCESIEIEEEVSVGVLEYGNFLNCFDMFGEEFSLNFDGEKFTFMDKNKGSKLEYFATRTDTIKECDQITPKKFGDPYSSFDLNPQNMGRVVKAFSILGEDLLKISSGKGDKEVNVSIANKGKSNSYSFSVPCKTEATKAFDMFYSHDHLMNLFKCNGDIAITIADRVLIGLVRTKEYSIRYYISRRS